MNNNYIHASIVPLIGGLTLAAEKVLNKKPEWIASWKDVFEGNDKYCLEYYDNQIPYIDLKTNNDSLKKVDISTGLPPCAGLSMSNLYSRGTNAKSNDFMLLLSEYGMKEIRPKAIIVENAPNLYTNAGKIVAERINDLAKQNDYSMSLIKTSSINHGIPQNRARSFFILWEGNKTPILNKIKRDYIPFHQFFNKDFKKTECVNQFKILPSEDTILKFLLNKFNTTKDKFLETFAGKRMTTTIAILEKNNLLNEALEYSDSVGDNKTSKYLSHVINKLNQNLRYFDRGIQLAWNNSNSLMFKTLPFLTHPHENRWLMTSEALALMGFPEDFSEKVYIPSKDSNKICQNCPVTTAADWISEIVESLDGNREWINTNGAILRQNNLQEMKPIY